MNRELVNREYRQRLEVKRDHVQYREEAYLERGGGPSASSAYRVVQAAFNQCVTDREGYAASACRGTYI